MTPWYGATIDGFRKGKIVLHIREWRGWPDDLDVPLPLKAWHPSMGPYPG